NASGGRDCAGDTRGARARVRDTAYEQYRICGRTNCIANEDEGRNSDYECADTKRHCKYPEVPDQERSFERKSGGVAGRVRCRKKCSAADAGCNGRAAREGGGVGSKNFRRRFEEIAADLSGRWS